MASSALPISVSRLLELARQLSPPERREFVDRLLAERFDATLSQADQERGDRAGLTDAEIQAEIDAVRKQRRQDRDRAIGS